MLYLGICHFFFLYGTADHFSPKPPICQKFRILWTFGKTSWIDSSHSLYIHRKNKQKKTDMHPCLEWDLNPQSQCSGNMIYTAWPLWPAICISEIYNYYFVIFASLIIQNEASERMWSSSDVPRKVSSVDFFLWFLWYIH